MATLNLRLDPRQMETGADRAERALDGVQREARQTESAIDRMATRGGRSTQALGGAVQTMGARMQGARGQIQNTAFQIGDFATQVGAGTSASVALGQQLPQLLGGFGALGAVLGAVVAIGVPLAASFIDMGESAEDAAKRVDDLQDSIDRLAEATQRASRGGIDTLIERYGALSAEVFGLVEAERQLSLVQATRQLEEMQQALASFTDVSLMDTLRGFADNAGGEIRKIQHEFDLTRQEAEALKLAFDDVANADGPRELSTAYAQVRDLLVDAVGGWENLTDEQVEFISNLNGAQDAAERMADAIEGGADQAARLSENVGAIDFSTALANAATLAERLGVSAELAMIIQNTQTPTGPAGLLPSTGGGSAANGPGMTYGMGLGLDQIGDLPGVDPMSRTRPQMRSINFGPAVSAAGGRGGGGVDEAERLADAYDRLIASLDPLERASQDLANAQETINAAQDAGIISAQEAADAYDLAAQEYDKMVSDAADAANELDSVSQTVGSSIDRMLDTIITRGGDASDVLRDLGEQLIAVGLKMGLSAAFPSIFGEGGFAPLSFDGGGYTGSGARSGGVDGKGGFPAILHPNETVVDHSKGQGMGGGTARLEVNIYGAPSEPEVRRGQNGRVDIDFRRAFQSEVQGGSLDKAMSQRFGLRPKAQGA